MGVMGITRTAVGSRGVSRHTGISILGITWTAVGRSGRDMDTVLGVMGTDVGSSGMGMDTGFSVDGMDLSRIPIHEPTRPYETRYGVLCLEM